MQNATRISVKFFLRKRFHQRSPESCCELQPHKRKFFHSQPPGKQYKTRGDLFVSDPRFCIAYQGASRKKSHFRIIFLLRFIVYDQQQKQHCNENKRRKRIHFRLDAFADFRVDFG